MKTTLKYRMYCIVLRHLSGVNKGVQANHSSVKYVWEHRDELFFKQYVNEDQTTIMVDGGTHQDMVELQRQFEELDVPHSYFIEPDLNDCMTAITVILDERVWDSEKYCLSLPEYMEKYEFHGNIQEWYNHVGSEKNANIIGLISNKKLSL